jgi:hypothetical protein
MPTSRGAEPQPVPNWPPPVEGENEPPPAGGARGGAGCCGVPSEGSSWVPLVASVEEVPGEPPARDSKTSVATFAAALRAVSTAVPTAPAAVVPMLDGRRNSLPTEAGMVGTGAEGVNPAAGAALAGVGG